MNVVFPVASVLALVALVLVSRVKFPFKAPSENVSLISSDRFFLPQGFPLFVNIVCIMVIPGFYLSLPHSLTVYAMFFCGLFLALVAEKYVFADAELKSQVIVGLILMSAAEFVSLSDQSFAEEMLLPALLALGVGVIGSRFLLFYIKLAKHCQRGTSMSSFFLAWELGLSLGIGLGFWLIKDVYQKSPDVDMAILNPVHEELLYPAFGLTVVSLLMYNFLVHPWYMKHRNR